jgi:anti-sigma B factor antagonist
MQIDERVVDGVTILDLKGRMTLGEGDELLKDKIDSLLQQGKKQIVLNLEGVPYIDSAGLGEIVRTYTTVSRQGGTLKLRNLTKRIQHLLVITKLLPPDSGSARLWLAFILVVIAVLFWAVYSSFVA